MITKPHMIGIDLDAIKRIRGFEAGIENKVLIKANRKQALPIEKVGSFIND